MINLRDPRLVATMTRQHGLITPDQARDHGVSTPYIRAALRSRSWRVILRGVYVDQEAWDALDPWHGQPLLRARAATMKMRRAWVLSHDSAAHAHGLDVLVVPGAPPADVHVTRPGDTNAWASNGIKHHLARYAPEDVVQVDGLPVLNVARTVVDIAREHGLHAGLVTADSALRRGLVTKDELRRVAETMASWPYITVVRQVIELADHRSGSAAEVLGRVLVLELDLGVPDLQWPFRRPDGRVAWCDIRVGRQIFEAHGKIKVLPPERGGVASKPAADVLWDQRKRERYLTAEGLGVCNLYWDDYFGAARAAAKLRIKQEWDHTVQRYGIELPEHLERNAQELRASQDRPSAS